MSGAFRRGEDRTMEVEKEAECRESSSRGWIKVGRAWRFTRLASFLALRSGTGLSPNGRPYLRTRSFYKSAPRDHIQRMLQARPPALRLRS